MNLIFQSDDSCIPLHAHSIMVMLVELVTFFVTLIQRSMPLCSFYMGHHYFSVRGGQIHVVGYKQRIPSVITVKHWRLHRSHTTHRRLQ